MNPGIGHDRWTEPLAPALARSHIVPNVLEGSWRRLLEEAEGSQANEVLEADVWFLVGTAHMTLFSLFLSNARGPASTSTHNQC